MAKIKSLPDPKIAARLNILMKRSKTLNGQEAIAAKAGVGQTTVGRILRGEVSSSINTYEAICRAFGVPENTLTSPLPEYDPLNENGIPTIVSGSNHVAIVSKEEVIEWTNNGKPLENIVLTTERRFMSTNLTANQGSHFLLVEDDSMLYDLPKGCWVHIDPTKQPIRGKIVEAKTKKGEIVFRAYKPLSNGGYELIAKNNMYDAIPDSDIEQIIGVKVEYRVIDPDYQDE